MKGRALRRALKVEPIRINADIPLIVDTTELITSDMAKEMLIRNHANRPVNWRKVEEYAETMRAGRWRLHGQGIMLDVNGRVLTGQKRLWAIVKCGMPMYMRVSRGNPPETATLIDRGVPQSARDLSARATGRIHSPVESSIVRAMLALDGHLRPSTDDISAMMTRRSENLASVMSHMRGGKKTPDVLMIVAALMSRFGSETGQWMSHVPILADQLRARLAPRTAKECWGKGVAFSLAMEQAKKLVTAI